MDNQETDKAEARQRTGLTLPAWLDGRTIALLATMLALGSLMQTAHFRLASDIDQLRRDIRGDIDNARSESNTGITGLRDELKTDIAELRDELKTDIGNLDDRLRAVEIDVAAIRTALVGFDGRLRAVEEHAKHPVSPASAAERT